MEGVTNKIRRLAVKAISQFNLLKSGDNVLVAVSGGIDSTSLLTTLTEIQRRAPFPFRLHPVLVDHKFPGVAYDEFADWLSQLGYDLTILSCNTYSLMNKERVKHRSPCQLCSRLRRGTLYTHARKCGYTKIALGHNRDDLNETILLNMFFSGKLASMPPKLEAEDGFNTVIRPLCLVPKSLIVRNHDFLKAPIVTNPYCEELPGNARYRIRELLRQLAMDNPKITENLLAAQGKILPHLLLDQRFWNS